MCTGCELLNTLSFENFIYVHTFSFCLHVTQRVIAVMFKTILPDYSPIFSGEIVDITTCFDWNLQITTRGLALNSIQLEAFGFYLFLYRKITIIFSKNRPDNQLYKCRFTISEDYWFTRHTSLFCGQKCMFLIYHLLLLKQAKKRFSRGWIYGKVISDYKRASICTHKLVVLLLNVCIHCKYSYNVYSLQFFAVFFKSCCTSLKVITKCACLLLQAHFSRYNNNRFVIQRKLY